MFTHLPGLTHHTHMRQRELALGVWSLHLQDCRHFYWHSAVRQHSNVPCITDKQQNMLEAVWIETTAIQQQSYLQKRWHHEEEKKPNPADFLQTVQPFWNRRPNSGHILAPATKGFEGGFSPKPEKSFSLCLRLSDTGQAIWILPSQGWGCPRSCSCCLWSELGQSTEPKENDLLV